MADTVTWLFDTDRDDGGIRINAVNIDMPEVRPGASISAELEFWDDPALDEVTTAGGTYGGLSHGGGTYGGSQSQPPIRGHRARYRAVREYFSVAGRAATNRTITGRVRVSERLPADAPVPSIIVRLRPSASLRAELTPSVWVLLSSHQDQTRYTADLARIDADLTVLAAGDEYATRQALKNDT
jgi:hypothetical protein